MSAAARAGSDPCLSVNVINSSLVQCTVAAASVGQHAVSLSLNGQTSERSVNLHRLCPEGQYSPAGFACGVCPRVRIAPFLPLYTLCLDFDPKLTGICGTIVSQAMCASTCLPPR